MVMFVKVMGTIGFLCYFLYDLNSIKDNRPLLRKFFGVGTAFVAAATAGIFWEGRECLVWSSLNVWIGGIVGVLMLALLVYTLFFALPFQKTYVEESQKRLAYTEGVYALCRHPGVLWYAGFYLSAAGMIGTYQALSDGVFLILWNVAYIILQDIKVFPETFTNYKEYQMLTPFLIPSGKSIRRCVETWGKGGERHEP